MIGRALSAEKKLKRAEKMAEFDTKNRFFCRIRFALIFTASVKLTRFSNANPNFLC